MTNHAAALATMPGRCGMKKKLPKKGTAGGPEKRLQDQHTIQHALLGFEFLVLVLVLGVDAFHRKESGYP